MRLPTPRGDYSRVLIDRLRGSGPSPESWAANVAVLDDDDFQLALWIMYALHYRGFDDAEEAAEWAPDLLASRRDLERHFEDALRTTAWDHVDDEPNGDVPDRLEALIGGFNGASIADHLHMRGTAEQVREVLAHRSVLQLKEADPYSWVIPRLSGKPKVGLVELQFDEYGDGQPDRLHQDLYVRTLEEVGLRGEFGAYAPVACAQMLALDNAVTFFGLHRRMRGAAMGHLAAFESTSSLPSRQYAAAIRKAGYGDAAAFYFDEHVEADAVHEQLATRGICGSLVAQEPSLAEDVMMGAAVCLVLDDRFGAALLRAWENDESLIDSRDL